MRPWPRTGHAGGAPVCDRLGTRWAGGLNHSEKGQAPPYLAVKPAASRRSPKPRPGSRRRAPAKLHSPAFNRIHAAGMGSAPAPGVVGRALAPHAARGQSTHGSGPARAFEFGARARRTAAAAAALPGVLTAWIRFNHTLIPLPISGEAGECFAGARWRDKRETPYVVSCEALLRQVR